MADAPVAVRSTPRDRSQAARSGLRRAARAAAASAPLAAAAAVLALAACVSKAPTAPPDPDATPATAQAVAPGEPHTDVLDCSGGTGPDCVDWLRYPPTGPGGVVVSVAPHVAPGETPPSPPVAFEIVVTDEAGTELGRASATAEAPLAVVRFEAKAPTAWLTSVRVPAGTPRAVYDVSWEARARGAAPATPGAAPGAGTAAVQTRRWAVLEVEAQGNLLIDGGRRDGLRPGQRGRLVDGARTLGRIVVSDVFEEGARARVEGALAGAITPDTVAEIEVPATSR